ncbi:penicillin-binding transpeptidase domain-containing protein [Streptomyces sp. NPDC007088]|uniref:penicillin-binding transpeptidase domain-containing protein n=1 Tax=Streptomyces sp. NPDC007088 TaxID=3364773 RepID=UPI0036BF95C4
MRTGAKAALVGGVLVVMVGGAGYGVFNIVSGITGGSGGGDTGAVSAEVRTGPLTGADVRKVTKEFFAAWEKRDAVGTAALTDNDAEATPVFASLREDAHVTKVRITPGVAHDTEVPYQVALTVKWKGTEKTVRYDAKLTVVRGPSTGTPLVGWEPAVAHPGMEKGDVFVTDYSSRPPIEAVDRDGQVLTGEKFPSLKPVLDTLRARYGEQAGGKGGVDFSIRHSDEDAPDTTLVNIEKGRPGKVRTTLSSAVQAAAEQAVKQYPNSSVVAEKPSTGEVLALANHRDDAFNAAFEGAVAPGSTMKLISAATLIDKGLATANSKAPCPDTALSGGQTVHNLTGMRPDLNATLAQSFARSCNTAFVSFAPKLGADDLSREAKEKFGLGLDWRTGIVSADGKVPAVEGDDKGMALIGQGQVQLNPLNMASVTSTVRTGTFHQPFLVPRPLTSEAPAQAAGLSPGTAAQIRQMMNLTATSGTGALAMRGLGPDIGAKTGSAEVDGQATSNSWFTGYRGDAAAAAFAEAGGHGGDTAGPIVAAVLRATG